MFQKVWQPNQMLHFTVPVVVIWNSFKIFNFINVMRSKSLAILGHQINMPTASVVAKHVLMFRTNIYSPHARTHTHTPHLVFYCSSISHTETLDMCVFDEAVSTRNLSASK